VARRQHARDGIPALRGGALQGGAPLCDAARFAAQRALLGLQARERAVRLRYRALGVLQRVARLAAAFFLFLDLPRDRLYAAAQGAEVSFA